MLTSYYRTHNNTNDSNGSLENTFLKDIVWIDLLNPTPNEENTVENILNLQVPTKKEMQEIEPSSRFYRENDALYITATLVAQSTLPEVKTDVVTFILTKNILVTLRYSEFQAFKNFDSVFKKTNKKYDAGLIFIELLDSTADRLADILEKISEKYDEISQSIFLHKNNGGSEQTNFQKTLQLIGVNADLGTKVNESIISLTRLMAYLQQTNDILANKRQQYVTVVYNDLLALREHANFLSTKFSFLLDATLGMINIEQNNIIKIFSVAAVIFLPPTLIASIYGMNFKIIPELDWIIGYPFAICLMILSAFLPYKFFKRKKWL